jgi:uncharacterized protein with FMN-binding domain
MKRFTSLFAFLFMLVSVAAFAGSKKAETVTFDKSVKVGNTELAPGDYKVSWNGTGPNVEVTFAQDKKAVTAPAQLVEKHNPTRAIATRTENGSQVLTEIQFKDVDLQFTGSQGQPTGQ